MTRVGAAAALDAVRSRTSLGPGGGLLLSYLALVVAAVWADLPGVFTPDTLPALYTAPERLLLNDLSSWVPNPYLGEPGLQSGRAPVSAALTALAATGLPDWALVRLWQALLLVAAALGAHLLYRRWVGSDGTGVGALAMAVLYTANPYVVVGGATTPTLLPYALLPWAVIALLAATARPGWRAPAAFAVVLFAMSGIQVGVVPLLQLLVVPVVVLDARFRRGVPWRDVLLGVVRCGVLGLAVSLYWLLPGLQAVALGTGIAAATETAEVIAGPSSPAEVLRGLGMWTMYGRDATGPFQPGFASYVTNPFVVLTSFAFPVLAAIGAAASRSRLRVPGVLLVAVAVPVMVGLYPFSDPTPFGRVLAAGFENVPGLIAMRTTNKAGGVLMLGLALLGALGAESLWRRVHAPRGRSVLVLVAAVSILGSAAPAVAGPLHPVQLDVPNYWEEAAAALDADRDAGRILVLPGTQIPRYRWGYISPADHLDGLFRRGTVQRQAAPNGSPQAANLLASLDTAFQEGSLTPGTLSTVARYLGVRDILLRHDLVWEQVAGARPADVVARASLDPGLEFVRGFGRPGENVTSSAPATADQAQLEETLQPVQHLRVVDPVPQVRAESLAGTVLVDGDSSAVSDLVATGVLAGRPSFRLLAGMSPSEVEQALADGAGIVLTDTNRRRDTAGGRLTAATGPTQPADAPVTRLLSPFQDPLTQTIAVLPGARVTATQSGSLFGPTPYGAPVLALDGDVRTGWLAGDFGSAVGQRLDLRLDVQATVGRVSLRPLDTTPVRLASVRLQVGDLVREVDLVPGEETVLDLPATETDSVSVTVLGVEGSGDGGVGLAELVLDGLDLEPTTRTPETLGRLAAGLSPEGRDRLDQAPLDVVLSRAQASVGTSDDDEEPQLSRDFTTIGEHAYDIGGVLRVGPGVPESAIDLLSGMDPLLAATSTSQFFDDPAVRASSAFDGDESTAWVPGRDAVGESVTIAFPPQAVDSVVLRQENAFGEVVDLATRVRVDLEDGRSVEAVTGPGATVIPLPQGADVGLLRVTLLDRSGTGALVRINEVEVEGVRMTTDAVRGEQACVVVGSVSGAPIRVRASLEALLTGLPTPMITCDGPLLLGPGNQQLRTAPGWVIDRLHLRDRQRPAAASTPPTLSATSEQPSAWSITVAEAEQPYALVLGQGADPQWEATINGRSLDPPVVLDGWSAGWRVAEPGPHVIEVRYGQQRLALAARVLSLLTLLGCAVLLLPRRPNRSAHALGSSPATAVRGARAGRTRPVAAWAGVVAVLWLVGGTFLGGAGVVLAIATSRSQRVRLFLPWLGVLLVALVPVSRLVEGLGDASRISADLVSGGVSGDLALLGLAVLVVGVLAQESSRSSWELTA